MYQLKGMQAWQPRLLLIPHSSGSIAGGSSLQSICVGSMYAFVVCDCCICFVRRIAWAPRMYQTSGMRDMMLLVGSGYANCGPQETRNQTCWRHKPSNLGNVCCKYLVDVCANVLHTRAQMRA